MTVNTKSSCPLGCAAGVGLLSGSGNGRKYLQCRHCGLAFVRHLPCAQEYQRQYLEDQSSTATYYRQTEALDRITFLYRLQWLSRFAARGRLLDIGCSVGTLLKAASLMGWTAEGIEPNPVAAAIARGQGFQVYAEFLSPDLVGRLQGGYQCVVMSDVLEHIPHPAKIVSLARQLLTPGGHLLISTPNLDSFVARRFQLKPGEHLLLFNADNLRMLLEKEGLSVIALKATSRQRALDQLTHSTTELGPLLERLVTLFGRLQLEALFSKGMARLLRDELVVIACKGG